ncbi:hypothetical protein SeLEV6574_g05841 [Synchytrium endobioticum]|uniref:BZIP domain-containing protein n=1 Tax=Synchytrium endobioticum TaxID=286115 RepID=A0A507CS27_9FUNG|nr:hypothetical protein SeLEV6574_g05841 [Synchytrium endobioticum]
MIAEPDLHCHNSSPSLPPDSIMDEESLSDKHQNRHDNRYSFLPTPPSHETAPSDATVDAQHHHGLGLLAHAAFSSLKDGVYDSSPASRCKSATSNNEDDENDGGDEDESSEETTTDGGGGVSSNNCNWQVIQQWTEFTDDGQQSGQQGRKGKRKRDSSWSGHESIADMVEKRRRNTEAARRSRLKKVQRLEMLETRVRELEELTRALIAERSLLLAREQEALDKLRQFETDLSIIPAINPDHHHHHPPAQTSMPRVAQFS